MTDKVFEMKDSTEEDGGIWSRREKEDGSY